MLYCSPNYDQYIERPDISIGAAARRYNEVIVAGDFNAKSKAWSGPKTDRRGNMLTEVLDRNHFAPIGTQNRFTFQRGSKRSFLDIMSASCKFLERYKRSGVLREYSASDYRYVLH